MAGGTLRLLLSLGAAAAVCCASEGSWVSCAERARLDGRFRTAAVLSGISKAGRSVDLDGLVVDSSMLNMGASAMHLRGGKGAKVKPDEYSEFTAPKKALSAYMLFANDIRGTVGKENPELKMTELSGVIGKKWKEITDEERAKYDALAEKAKKKFEKDKADYEAKVPANVRKDRDQAKKKAKMADKKHAAKDPNRPKKAASAFMLYATSMRASVKEANPSLGFGDLTRKVAEQWNAMTDAEKEPYNKDAAIAKEKQLAAMAKYTANKAKEEPAVPEKVQKKAPKAK